MRAARLAAAVALVCAAPFASLAQTPTQGPASPPSVEAAPADEAAEAALELDSRSIPVGGVLSGHPLWSAWKAGFVTDQGRVIDTANGRMSHSEGQGYGMLLAVAADDRVGFERIWAWTRANLMVRGDALLAWRWEADKRPAVGDLNNATDGDLLVAWALTEAAEHWNDASYRVAARRIAVEAARKTIALREGEGPLLLPASAGFGPEDRSDGPVVNLSYWVFPAFERLRLAAPEIDWRGVAQTGLDLLKKAQFGVQKLPSDWISARDGKVAPAQGFPPQFGYNAVRIPLYMAMAGVGERAHYQPFVTAWKQPMATVDVAAGTPVEPLSESGYRAVSLLTDCAVSGARVPAAQFAEGAGTAAENYYPATLRLLALVALRTRYPSCMG